MPLANVIPQIPDPILALFIAMAALIYAIKRWRRNVIRKNRSQDKAPMKSTLPSSAISNQISVREVSEQIRAMLADIEETARRAAAQVDNRAMKLELLLIEADKKIKQLEALTAAPLPQTPTAEQTRDSAATLLSQLRHERSAPSPADDPAYAPIYQLADQGKSPREIAQTLSRQPGEIELILALRSR